ncbi:hypothetical protein ACIBG8_06625 [Nonomuraea sp. NPDC050556]|uniref:hypothetical protein n=1 Tax=Nonomuraea sp. NPDC050556 TaxID=3364369 RepID=UPI00378C875E
MLLLYIPLYLAHSNSAARYVDLAYPLPEDGRPGKEWAAGRTVLGASSGRTRPSPSTSRRPSACWHRSPAA